MDTTQIQHIIGGVIIFIISLIKIPKLELNIWSYLMKMFSTALNKEVMSELKTLKTDIVAVKDDLKTVTTKVNNLETKIVESNEQDEERDALSARQRILIFNDDLLYHDDILHTKERFDNVLNDIDMYEKYCNSHKNFSNNQAVMAIQNIKDVYKYCVKNHRFLEQRRNDVSGDNK